MNSKELLENLEDNGRDYLLPVRIYKQIKQDLDRLEQIEKENQELREKLDGFPPEYDSYLYFAKSISNVVKENTKLKKALDILKDKEVSLESFKISVDLDTYHEILKDNPFYDKLTQEEFKLLKEMLEEE